MSFILTVCSATGFLLCGLCLRRDRNRLALFVGGGWFALAVVAGICAITA